MKKYFIYALLLISSVFTTVIYTKDKDKNSDSSSSKSSDDKSSKDKSDKDEKDKNNSGSTVSNATALQAALQAAIANGGTSVQATTAPSLSSNLSAALQAAVAGSSLPINSVGSASAVQSVVQAAMANSSLSTIDMNMALTTLTNTLKSDKGQAAINDINNFLSKYGTQLQQTNSTVYSQLTAYLAQLTAALSTTLIPASNVTGSFGSL